jgi:hypothetical protein
MVRRALGSRPAQQGLTDFLLALRAEPSAERVALAARPGLVRVRRFALR